ncbi:choice-of-anchor Q domain-containing protein [Lacipirellula parvula]|nr:choice-of-anchor Q domain-containing protein [Lacipirellula parvula]
MAKLGWRLSKRETNSSRGKKLRHEQLEERRVLTTYWVSNDFDSGSGSLRYAIGQANAHSGADEIKFDASFNVPRVIALTTGQINITDELEVSGPGANLLTVRATDVDGIKNGNGSRIFSIDDGNGGSRFLATIAGVTLTGGDVDGTLGAEGGAIRSLEDLEVHESVISNNAIVGLASNGLAAGEQFYGGGIAVLYGAELTISSSIVTNNQLIALVSGVELVGITLTGAGVYSGGNLTVTDSIVSKNSSFIDMSYATDDIDQQSGHTPILRGGGIAIDTGELNVTRTVVDGNSLKIAGQGIDSQSADNTGIVTGAGIYAVGGAYNVSYTTISNNVAEWDIGFIGVSSWLQFEAFGAGAYLVGDTVVDSSTFSGNQIVSELRNSLNLHLLPHAFISQGAGIYLSGIDNAFDIRHSTIANNHILTGEGWGKVEMTGAGLQASAGLSLNHVLLGDNDFRRVNTSQVVREDLSTRYYPGGYAEALDSEYSLIETFDVGSSLSGNGNILSQDPSLERLDANGGFFLPDGSRIQTHALRTGSLAIDSGDEDIINPPDFDQRLTPYERIFNGDGIGEAVIDIGAFEKQPIDADDYNADFNNDGRVDGADFLIWQRGFGIATGATHSQGDANFDGDVDSNDLDIWKQQFGRGMGSIPSADYDTNGHVDRDDFLTWMTYFGTSTGATLSTGDADADGDVDEFDFLAWQIGFSDEAGGWSYNGGNDEFGDLTSGTILVSTLEDEDDGDYRLGRLSLREAIAIASEAVGVTEIVFASGLTGTIELALGALVLSNDVTINGPDAEKLVIDAGGLSRVFTINAGTEVTISGLTVTGGGNVSTGGGILNNGVLTLESVVVSGNTTTALGYGGGILTQNGLTGTASLYLRNSTVDGNHAAIGSGLYLSLDDGEVEITGSTISNNVALGLATSTYSAGGGLAADSTNTSSIEITNSTFSGNHAFYSGGIRLQNSLASFSLVNSTIAYNIGNDSGGLQRLNNTSDPVLHNTIVSENTAHSTSTKLDILGSVDLTNSTYNLIGSGGAGGLSNTNGNIILSSPNTAGLAPLGDYGGKTKTHALKTTSPAIDKGSNAYATTYDQRGLGFTGKYDLPDGTYPNGGGGYRDIGAYEASTGTTLIVRSDDDRNNSVNLKATTDSLRLREAIALSADLAGKETIVFDFIEWNDDEIALSSILGSLDVTSDLTIYASDVLPVTINAFGNSSVFVIDGATVVMRGITITGGNGDDAGGIYASDSNLTLDEVSVSGNTGADTGGVLVDTGVLTIINSTVDDNQGDLVGGVKVLAAELNVYGSTISSNGGPDSGGIYLLSAEPASILNSTISGNTGYWFGGVAAFGGTSLSIINSTITDNSADTSGYSGGLMVGSYTTAILHNTILAGNYAGTSDSDLYVHINGDIDSDSSYNLIGYDPDDYFSDLKGNIRGTISALDAKLMPLADNGGPTLTHALMYDSAAVDAGDDTIDDLWEIDFDQRGFDRTADNVYGFGDGIDIGAVELAVGELYA